MYHELNPDKIVETISTLSRRINERFPDSGLLTVCNQLVEISRRAQYQADWIARPIISLRLGIGFLIIVIVAGIIGTMTGLKMPTAKVNFLKFIQVLEAGINDVVLIGVAIFFLVTLERRLKRRRALKSIHELRALAHIIDMHQLTKDPDRLLWEAQEMVPSRAEKLTPLQLTRYLDYCSEMLSWWEKLRSCMYITLMTLLLFQPSTRSRI